MLILLPGCSRDPTKIVGDLCIQSSYIVKGSIYQFYSKMPAKMPGIRYHWNAQLAVFDVLQGGLPSDQLHIRWDEPKVEGVAPYSLSENGIWFFHSERDENYHRYYVIDAYLPMDYLQEVERHLPSRTLPKELRRFEL